MGKFRYFTAGESHGKGLTAIIEGLPANLRIKAEVINKDLARRQTGYGRGGRMKIERDKVEILSGIRHGKTLGSPVAMFIENMDWQNWKEIMTDECLTAVPSDEVRGKEKVVTRPRPGHADLSGAIKYSQRDVRNILERSSARETAARVAVGAVGKALLAEFGIGIFSWVTEIGGVQVQDGVRGLRRSAYYKFVNTTRSSSQELCERAESSEVRCPENDLSIEMKKRIDEAKAGGDSLGGVFEIVITGVPVGLGSHVQWDRKLNMRLASAVMSIQAIKGVEFGLGFESASLPGSLVHDEIFYKNNSFVRDTNNAGGIEGGMSNGQDIVIRAVMKPIPTLYKPLCSVDILSKEAFEASIERSDICAVPAASVVGEAVVATVMADAMMEKFAGDSIEEMKRNYDGYMEYVRRF